MADTLPAPKSRKEEFLATAAGMTGIELPEPASREEQYLNAIAEGGGGGGGGYVLPTASASTLGGVKVGSNLSIDGSGVLSATGGGSIARELTEADYNYPEDNPEYLDLGTLPIGLYYVAGYQGLNVYYEGGTNYFSSPCTFIKCYGNVVVMLTDDYFPDKISHYVGTSSSVALSRDDIVDNLTTDTGVRPLSARQGRILGERNNVLSPDAPTTETEGVLGQLYTDTTNMHTYQCTAIDETGDNPVYTWTQRW